MREGAVADQKPELSKAELKTVVQSIIVAQGNEFIKELARSRSVKIGTTKKEFSENLGAAIDDGTLTQAMIDEWLADVEGWGNQHVFLYEAPDVAAADVEGLVKGSEHAELLGSGITYDFPDVLTLKAILVDAERLSMVWQQGKTRLSRFKKKDYEKTEGSERYWFEAYLKRADRSLVRFEWRFGDDYCGVLIHRNKDIDHAQAIAQVWKELKAIGISTPLTGITLNQAIKAKSKGKGAQNSRFDNKDGYVEYGSKKAEGGIDEVEGVRKALKGLDDNDFDDTRGMFQFKKEEGKLGADVSVQIYGNECRLRLWARCTRPDVYELVKRILDANAEAA
jgi:hypothetical protein